MSAPRTQSEQNVALVLKYLKQFMDLRFAHARRLNSKFKGVEADLKWHELECVKQVLARQKPLGEARVTPADLIVGFDGEKKRAVFMPKGQLSILNEIITKEDSSLSKGGGDGIRDMSSFYKAVDPFLKGVVDIMQAWVWWDLPDAADMALIEMQFDKLRKLPRMQFNEQIAAYYKNDIKEPSMQAIVDLEFYRTEDVVVPMVRRREGEENYQAIIARESEGGGAATAPADQTIAQMSQRLRAVEMLKAGQLDANLRDYYSKMLQCRPEEVAPERAIAVEEKALAQARQTLAQQLEAAEEGGGNPYNFKLRQAQEVVRQLEAIRAEVRPRPRDAGKSKEQE